MQVPSDKVEGKTHEVIGRGKEAIGAATGNDDLRADGLKDQAGGKVQQLVGEVKEGAEKIGEKIKDAVSHHK